MILETYKQIFGRNPSLFGNGYNFSLSPLSSVMAELFDTFEHNDVLLCLKILGSSKIDNYGEEMIVKLYENYSQQTFMAKLYNQNP